MNGNSNFRHSNTSLLAVAATIAPVVVTSAEIDNGLRSSLKRLHLPKGLLQRLAGVYERRAWDSTMSFDEAAMLAARRALADAQVDSSEVGLLINTSVTRRHLEPSVAVAIHHGLALPSSAMNFDITNACLGFVNGMSLAAQLIEAGQIRYAVIVDGEDANELHQNTLERLSSMDLTRDAFIEEFASLTLGSGAAAAVLGPSDVHPAGHRILGGIARAATEHHNLCVGDFKGMYTDAKRLLTSGLELVLAAWNEAKTEWDWGRMDRYITHQVSSVHTSSIIKAAGLDPKRVPTTFPNWGNVGPASLPMTLAAEAPSLHPGDRVLCMGVGSGLNTAMTEIRW
ncbi:MULTISPECIES: 3-oxoacyl-ACP synthase III [unclassified Diaminobutyricimonas]|uniref:3-oxoacyl-ACP synthase III n=1 Tax=unclassified Diaminobutyricimonas TaxID=2643261 RepID=UPI0012F4B9F2|nr:MULTISPECIES: 3-oxoacyl-ACP synthase III [unclassified Diaminobutyricimonas]